MHIKWIKIKGLIDYLIYCVVILVLAFFLKRFLQMLIFIMCYNLIQNCFNKRFHSDSVIDNPVKAVKYCKIITIVVELLYLIYCKELDVSVYSNLLVIFIIAFINALLQFYCERTVNRKINFSDLDTLTLACKEAQLSELSTRRMILRYVEKKTEKEIADLEYVDVDTIKKSLYRSRKKILRH